MIRVFVVKKSFENDAGRMLPVGIVGDWDENDMSEQIQSGHLELYDPLKHGELNGAFATSVTSVETQPQVRLSDLEEPDLGTEMPEPEDTGKRKK